MSDNTLNISIAVDISSLQAGMTAAATATQDFSDRASAALQAYNDISAQGVISQKMLGEAFDKAAASGANSTEAMEAAVAAFAGGSSAAEQEAAKVDILSAAERQYAQATLEAVTARKALLELIAANVGRTDESSVTNVAAAQQRAITTVEQLALAKANLSEVQEYVATTAAQEADALETSASATSEAVTNVNALGEAYAKLDAEILGVEGTVLANFEGSTGAEAQTAEVTDLSAAYAQLAEATLEAASAKQALNDAITMYAGRSDEEAIAVTVATQRQATQATDQLVLAKKNLAEVEEYSATAANMETAALSGDTSALVENIGATEALTTAQTANVSSTMAAQGALRTLEGSAMGASRAAGSFLSTTLGLGPVLEAAFPIIGAAALLSILYQVGDEFYTVYEKANQAADAIADEYAKSNEAIAVQIDDVGLLNSKLQDQIDKLEGHPSNGLKTALLEAVDAADKLEQKLEGDNDALEGLLKRHEVGLLKGVIGGIAPTTGLDQEIVQHSDKTTIAIAKATQQYDDAMRAAGGDKDKIADAVKQRSSATNAALDNEIAGLQVRLKREEELQARNQKLMTVGGVFTDVAPGFLKSDHSAAINTLEGQILRDQRRKQETDDQMQTQPLQAKKNQLESEKGGANKAEEQHLRDLETQFTEEKVMFGKSAEQAAAYWDQYIGDFQKGSSEYKEVLDKIASAQAEFGKHTPQGVIGKELDKEAKELKKQSAQDQKVLEEMAKIPAGLQKKLDAIDAATEKLQAKALAATAEHEHQENLGALQTAQAKEQSQYDLSLIKNPEQQLNELRAFHVRVAAEEEKLIQQLITIDAKYPNEVDRLEKQLDEVRRKADLQWIKDSEKTALQVQQAISKAYKTAENDIDQMLAKTLSGQETWANAAMQVYRKVSETFINNILKMTEQYVVGLATQKTGQLSLIEGDAKTAAANTYASVSAIPLVGPVLAPPAAAAAFAAVMAFGSFEHGGIVDGAHGMPVPIMAHAGERVLSAPQTQNFERMVNQSGGAGNTLHVNYNPSINAFDRNGMRSTLRSHQGDIVDIVREAWNQGKFK